MKQMISRLAVVTLLLSTLSGSLAWAGKVPLHEATLAELAAAMKAGSLTSEKLVRLSLARIEAYDRHGPNLRAVIAFDPKALSNARALDAERRSSGPRSPLHGIPVLLKDNFDTADLPTTGGSLLLEGSLPPDDAFLVKKLRAAGAVILGKTNMSEFAASSTQSSLGGVMRNPHDLQRSPGGSSGGSGIAVAAAYATLTLGSDTGGSIRSPAAMNGVAGLKPTQGLLSRDGIIPLAASFDVPGPLARNVSDIAIALGVLVGVDPADAVTASSEGKYQQDYTQALDGKALKGARIGVGRDFVGVDSQVDWVFEAALARMVESGAMLVDVRLPKWLMNAKNDFYTTVRDAEFKAQIGVYLQTLAPKYPKSLEQLLSGAMKLNTMRDDGAGPNPERWTLFKRENTGAALDDYRYLSVRDHALPMVRASVEGLLAAERLDAIVYPTSPRSATLISEGGASTVEGHQPYNVANLGGFPDLSVPAGFTGGGVPVNISFLGPLFAEPKLLQLGYSFEQVTHARRLPVTTPPLAGETIVVQ